MAGQCAECDTFDQIAQACQPGELSLQFLNEALLGPLAAMPGIVVRGKASPIFCFEEPWGSPLTLPTGEQLHLRTYPPNLVTTLQNGYRPMVALLAARRVGRASELDDVAFALLWDESVALQRAVQLVHAQAQTKKNSERPDAVGLLSDASRGTRQLHILVPSLFRHHEPSALRKTSQTRWPDHDDENFHRIPAKSFSVRRIGKHGPTLTPIAGWTRWVLAGDFVDVDVDEPDSRAAQTIDEDAWREKTRVSVSNIYQTARQNGYGPAHVETAVANASLVCDMLTAESIVGMLGEPVLDGAWPDLLHLPSGFPLLVAFAVRVACYPERYKLPPPTAGDQWANNQIVSIFEATWKPLTAESVGGVENQYAIDLALARAWAEAVAQAKGVLGDDVSDNVERAPRDQLRFWQRAGQRCCVEIFGAAKIDFEWPKPPFGPCNTLDDPLGEARRRVLRRTLKKDDATADGVSLPFGHQTMRMKRQMLVQLLNSVEHWLRTGLYSGYRLKPGCRPSPEGGAASSPAAAGPLARDAPLDPPELPASTTAGEVRLFLSTALDRHIADRIKTEPAVSKRGAATLRNRVLLRLEDFLQNAPDDAVVGALPTDAELAAWLEQPTLDDVVEGAPSALPERSAEKELNGVDNEALDAAAETLRTAISYGSLVLQEYGMHVHVNHAESKNVCADCGATVHVLGAAFLSSSCSRCATCCRPRCLDCAGAAARAAATGANVKAACRRCKDVAKALRKEQKGRGA